MNSLIKEEYFSLLNKLNRSNKTKNQNTEIYFYIEKGDVETENFFAAISDSQRILLCEKPSDEKWRPAYLSGFFNLEEFLVKILNARKQEIDITELIKSHIFKL